MCIVSLELSDTLLIAMFHTSDLEPHASPGLSECERRNPKPHRRWSDLFSGEPMPHSPSTTMSLGGEGLGFRRVLAFIKSKNLQGFGVCGLEGLVFRVRVQGFAAKGFEALVFRVVGITVPGSRV